MLDEPVEKRRRTEESTDETCVPAASAAVGSTETERAQHPEFAAQLSDFRRFVEEHVEILRARSGPSLQWKLKRKDEEGGIPGEKQWRRFLTDNTARFTPEQKAEITALFDRCRSVAVVVSVRTRQVTGKFQVHCTWKEKGNTKNKYGPRRASEACAKQDEKAVKQRIDENPANPLAAAKRALQEREAVPEVSGPVSTSDVYAKLRGVPVPSSGSAAAPPSAESSLATRDLRRRCCERAR